MSENVISFDRAVNILYAKDFLESLGRIAFDRASYNVTVTDFKNISRLYTKLDFVSAYKLSEIMNHSFHEVNTWLAGDVIPQNPLRTIIIIAMELLVKKAYNV